VEKAFMDLRLAAFILADAFSGQRPCPRTTAKDNCKVKNKSGMAIHQSSTLLSKPRVLSNGVKYFNSPKKLSFLYHNGWRIDNFYCPHFFFFIPRNEGKDFSPYDFNGLPLWTGPIP
jgi:hypothetical protein